MMCLERNRFAHAGAAQDAERLARHDVEADVLEYVEPAEGFGDVSRRRYTAARSSMTVGRLHLDREFRGRPATWVPCHDSAYWMTRILLQTGKQLFVICRRIHVAKPVLHRRPRRPGFRNERCGDGFDVEGVDAVAEEAGGGGDRRHHLVFAGGKRFMDARGADADCRQRTAAAGARRIEGWSQRQRSPGRAQTSSAGTRRAAGGDRRGGRDSARSRKC